MTRDGREQAIIRERAFAIWEEEGHPEGKSVAHWCGPKPKLKRIRLAVSPIMGNV